MLGFTQWAEVDSDLKRVRSAGITLCATRRRLSGAAAHHRRSAAAALLKGACTDADAKAVAIVARAAPATMAGRVARDSARGLASFGFHRRQRYGARHRRHGPRDRTELPGRTIAVLVPASSAAIRRSMLSFISASPTGRGDF